MLDFEVLRESFFMIVGVIFLVIYYFFLLAILLTTIVYFCGYLYDAIIGNGGLRFCTWIAQKRWINSNKRFARKIREWCSCKILYLRYDTPLCTYCLSCTAVLIINDVLMILGISDAMFWATILYLGAYFVGMYRKCNVNRNYYDKVLENNLHFLKLSFVPLSFLVTALGLFFAMTGTNMHDININYREFFRPEISEYIFTEGIGQIIRVLLKDGFKIIVLLYITSVPLQLISYYIILVIKYFKKYNESYISLLRRLVQIFVSFF